MAASCECGRDIPFHVLRQAFARRAPISCTGHSGCGVTLDQEAVAEHLRGFLRQGLEAGCHCPGCGAWAKRYNRKLNSSIARWLLELVRKSPNGEWVPGREVTDVLGALGKDATTLLPDWGLIEGCAVCERDKGMWRPTPLGRRFAACRAKVPRTIYAYNRMTLGHDEDKGLVTIRDALGDKFDYDELMSEE